MSAIASMLQKENVQICESAKDWKDSIHIAVSPLVKQGYVEARYIDGIIQNAEKYGPYFVIAPNLALLHGRPEQGVIKRQLAVTVLRTGVVYKEGSDPVQVLVTLAAEDADSHIDVMRDLATKFADPEAIAAAAKASDAEELYSIFVAD